MSRRPSRKTLPVLLVDGMSEYVRSSGRAAPSLPFLIFLAMQRGRKAAPAEGPYLMEGAPAAELGRSDAEPRPELLPLRQED